MEIFVNLTGMFMRPIVEFWETPMNRKLLEKLTFCKRGLYSSFYTKRLYF